MKRALALVLLLICLVTAALPAGAEGYTAAVSADAALLYDRTEDRVLYAKNASGTLNPGKSVQLMTALLAAERLRDEDKSITVKLPYSAASNLPTPLTEGTVMTLGDLLAAVLLTGSEDAALALAMAVYPDADSFVEEMNLKASDLGMTGTTYVNPTGAYDKKQLTTVNDFYLLAKALWDNELLAGLLAQPEAKIGTASMSLTNNNAMVPGGGSTSPYAMASASAGYAALPAGGSDGSLALMARPEEHELLCLLLGGSDLEAMMSSAADLLAFGSGSTTEVDLKELLEGIPLSYAGSNGSYYTVTPEFPEDQTLLLPVGFSREGISVRLQKEKDNSGSATYYDAAGKELARIPVTFTRVPSAREISGRKVLLAIMALLTLFLCLVLIFALRRFYYTYEYQKRQRQGFRMEGAPTIAPSSRYVRNAFYHNFPVWVLWAAALVLLVTIALCFNLYNR